MFDFTDNIGVANVAKSTSLFNQIDQALKTAIDLFVNHDITLLKAAL